MSLDRDPAAVVQDVRADRISAWTAREVFGVLYDTESLIVDEDATRDARQAHRARRLERGRPYAEFIADWERRLPPDDALKYFGEWPSGAPNRDVVRI